MYKIISYILLCVFLTHCKEAELSRRSKQEPLDNIYYDFSKVPQETIDKGYQLYRDTSYKVFKPKNFDRSREVNVIVLLGGMGSSSQYNRVMLERYIQNSPYKVKDLKVLEDSFIISILPPGASMPFLKSGIDKEILDEMGEDAIRRKNGGFFNFLFRITNLENSPTYSRGPSFFEVNLNKSRSIAYNLSELLKVITYPIIGKKIEPVWRFFLDAKDEQEALNAIDQSAKVISDFLDDHLDDYPNIKKQVTVLADSQGGVITLGMFAKYRHLFENIILKCIGFYPNFRDIKEAQLLPQYESEDIEDIKNIKVRLGKKDPIWPGDQHIGPLLEFFIDIKKVESDKIQAEVIETMGHVLPGNLDFANLRDSMTAN